MFDLHPADISSVIFQQTQLALLGALPFLGRTWTWNRRWNSPLYLAMTCYPEGQIETMPIGTCKGVGNMDDHVGCTQPLGTSSRMGFQTTCPKTSADVSSFSQPTWVFHCHFGGIYSCLSCFSTCYHSQNQPSGTRKQSFTCGDVWGLCRIYPSWEQLPNILLRLGKIIFFEWDATVYGPQTSCLFQLSQFPAGFWR